MTSEVRKRYVPQGVAAIDPQALGVDYREASPEPDCTSFTDHGNGVASIRIVGPITYAPAGFDTYAAIESRFDNAAKCGAKTVVLCVASPGGDVSGAFDCARSIRRKAAAAGIKLITHSDDKACSAAYVLACAADTICCSDTATIGSIGVILQLADTSRAEAAMGLRFETITSGARKADGNPHIPLTDDARAAIQVSIDAMASVFFEHVGNARQKLGAAGAQALQAGVAVGHDAVTAKLADRVISFSELITELVTVSASPQASAAGGYTSPESLSAKAGASFPAAKAPMADEKDDEKDKPKEDAVRAGLVTASESDDEKKASRAKRALAAYDAEDDDDKKKKDEEAKASAATASAAASAAAAAHAAATTASLSARLEAFEAKALADERAALFASRADLPKASIDAVRELPVATARAILASIPVMVNPNAPVVPKASVGDPSVIGAHASSLSLEEQAKLDAQFGIVPKNTTIGTRVVGAIQQFGVAVPLANGVVQ